MKKIKYLILIMSLLSFPIKVRANDTLTFMNSFIEENIIY